MPSASFFPEPARPTTAGIVDYREDHKNAFDRFVSQDDAISEAVAALFQTMLKWKPGTEYSSKLGIRGKFSCFGLTGQSGFRAILPRRKHPEDVGVSHHVSRPESGYTYSEERQASPGIYGCWVKWACKISELSSQGGDGEDSPTILIVTDGAVIPTALGVNPFAIITALAEWSVEHAAKRFICSIYFSSKNGLLDLLQLPDNL
ncbi:hypothetical protein BJ878DRAFT_193207 [Calycina marina]|uniref:Uncharacterized protein n=1 Tax=Calycina marina TaxID=1763456 RepID=A0A9P7YY05_9HELO|nr:hypothetical protein BJ878DRAFT_193207 [Calycina marina]